MASGSRPRPLSPASHPYGAVGPTTPYSSTANLLPPHSANESTVYLSPGPGETKSTPSLRSKKSSSSLRSDPYEPLGLSKFSPFLDLHLWDNSIYSNEPEPDDYLHNPDPRRDKWNDQSGTIFTRRGLTNLGCMLILVVALIGLFAGYPVTEFLLRRPQSTGGGFNVGGINSSGQVPQMTGNWGLIDIETPDYALTRVSFNDPTQTLQLVWSDEFNTDGRTFYPGDDPYWEAVDLHYWQTGNLEWYDPEAVTTRNGALEITLSEKQTHDLNYQGGMVTTWNKFCFTGGLLEASVTLPGINNVLGLWPAIWTMGNLGRAGYGASLEGMWPYSYDSCDVGTVANQTKDGLPLAATENGDPNNGGVLSFLPGQKLSRCTCPGGSHPGPMHDDGTFVGRSAPELDMFEAVAGEDFGSVSQTCQFAPFNAQYDWPTEGNFIIANATITHLNGYKGGAFQQAVSGLTQTNQTCYQLADGCFAVYGVEYKPGFDDAYVTWINDNQTAWTLLESGMIGDTSVEISARPIPQEPMYIIANLGMSQSFGNVDLDHLIFPAVMRIDYIRVYQRPDSVNVGCDPAGFPTSAYIEEYIEAYTNPNLTTWRDDYGQVFPKNGFVEQC
ncbi:beta-glucan synthesis-associated [Gloeopeniophorella convolvens]|nr:beta-glucan synthesis-associated [Gloeopeniophorella convolvens]